MTRSGAKVTLSGSKTASMYRQRKKGAKLMWTQPWRRMHKKLSQDSAAKRKVRKVVKTVAARSMEGRDSATVRAHNKGGRALLPSGFYQGGLGTPTGGFFPCPLLLSLLHTPLTPHPICSVPCLQLTSMIKKVAPKKEAPAAGSKAAPVKQAQIEAAKAKAKEQRAARKVAQAKAGPGAGTGARAGKGGASAGKGR